jgi:hypothetical protein
LRKFENYLRNLYEIKKFLRTKKILRNFFEKFEKPMSVFTLNPVLGPAVERGWQTAKLNELSCLLPSPSPAEQGPHRGGGKRDSLQKKQNPLETSESVRVAGRFGPEAPTMYSNSSYVTAFVF